MSEKRPITRQGYEAIKEKIHHIISVERPQVAREIAEARAHGDLKENAEYHSAKDKQGLLEASLHKLNDALAHCEVMEKPEGALEKVHFGANVTYLNLETGDEYSWHLVGSDEADSKQGKISIDSPIGRAIVGKMVGDVFTVNVPKGQMEIEILKVE